MSAVKKGATFEDIIALDAVGRDLVLAMLTGHKDFPAVIEGFEQRRAVALEEENRQRALNEVKRREAQSAEEERKLRIKAYEEKERLELEAERKRIAALTLEQKRAERSAIESPIPTGWTLMGGGIDLRDEWDEEHERLNDLYGQDSFVHPGFRRRGEDHVTHLVLSDGDLDL
jgi:hypothetical protein